MASTVIAGKPSNTVGEKDSALILRGSSVRVQWGNKFIDLIKNGKINAEYEKILKSADSIDNIKQDGIYLIGDQVWLVLNGTKVQLAGDNSTIYVAFTEQQETTGDNKITALKNIGFYYNTLQDAQNSGIKSGIVYILEENKLYTIIDGQVQEYYSENPKKEEEVDLKTKLYIEEYSLFVNGDEYIRCDYNRVDVIKQLVAHNGIQSTEASPDYGYRLYMEDEESYIEADNIIERNYSEKLHVQQTKYYQEDNLIVKVSQNNDSLKLQLLKSDKYKVNDVLTTTVVVNYDETYTLVPIDFTILSISNNEYVVSYKIYSDNTTVLNKISDNIDILNNKLIYYKQGSLPVAKIEDHNYNLYDQEQKLQVRVGTLNDLQVKPLEVPITTYFQKECLGIYSENSLLNNSKLIMPDIYISENKKYLELNTKIGEIYSILDTKQLLKYYNRTKTLGIYTDNGFLKDSNILNSEIYLEDNSKLIVKLGSISGIKIENKDITTFTSNTKGFYSNNAVLQNPKLIKSEEYNPVFKDIGATNVSEKYPRYDDLLTLPNNLLQLDNAVPNVEWVKQLIDLCVPVGTIVMWHGNSGDIPKGWAVCNGQNGTPNLIGRFIKADTNLGEVTPNGVTVDSNGFSKITIKEENLPAHSHPHNYHYHDIGSAKYSTEVTSLSGSLIYQDYLWNLQVSEPTKITYATPHEGAGKDSIGVITSVTASQQGGPVSIPNHKHEITIPEHKTQEAQSTEATKTWTNSKITIEPRHYKLIFIMKIKKFNDL